MKNRLTPFSKFLITLAIVAGLFFGVKWIMDNTAWGQSMKNKSDAESTTIPSGSSSTATAENTDVASSNGSTSQATAVSSRRFDYVPPEPINGTLRGVVELGASGFNSFIVLIDKNKNWKLEKSEFGNSLVTENMATDDDIRIGLKKYIGQMLDYGVNGKNIHFVVSSGAAKADVTTRIVKVLKSLGYFVNTVTPEQEGAYALKCVLPKPFESEAFVVDIGSGNTKVSWKRSDNNISAFETFGAKYYQNGTDDGLVYKEVKRLSSDIPTNNRTICFMIGGVPYQLAKEVRNGKERYTVLQDPPYYSNMDDAKARAGLNIYKAIKDQTGTDEFVFDWDANFTIGFLLSLPN